MANGNRTKDSVQDKNIAEVAARIGAGSIRFDQAGQELAKARGMGTLTPQSAIELEGDAIVARLGALETMRGVSLSYLRTLAGHPTIMQVRKGDRVDLVPTVQNSIGDNISITGPFQVNVSIVNVEGEPIGDSRHYSLLVPMVVSRDGVVDGVSMGAKLLSKLDSQMVNVTVEGKNFATRSPTFMFETVLAAARAKEILDGPETLQKIKETVKLAIGNPDIDVDRVTATIKQVNSHYELSFNIIYGVTGSRLGHETGTALAGAVLEEVVRPAFTDAGIKFRDLWLAGGEDGDLRISPKNVRGRKVSGSVFLPEEFLTSSIGCDTATFVLMNNSKYWVWNNHNGAITHTGMELEVLSAIYAALNPATSPFVSSGVHISATAAQKGSVKGVLFTFMARLEYGDEGIRTLRRKELESILGINESNSDSAENAAIFSAAVVAASLGSGLNQHRLGVSRKLDKTKREIEKIYYG